MKKVLVLLALVTLFACARKEEPKKDDFLGTTGEKEQPSRIKVLEGQIGWSAFQIIEVDGHQYLANSNHGGFIHLESCPCKTK
jgi:hypothetical protein